MTTITKRLILSVGSAQEPILWCWGYPADPCCQQQGELYPGETLPEELQGIPATVLVPGQHVVLRSVQFHGARRLANAQALAFQCEDQLLEDVEDLHWVILDNDDVNYALAGYRRTDMQHWLSMLSPLGIRTMALLPDVLGQPYTGKPSVHSLRQFRLFRSGKWSGYCLPQHWPLGQLAMTADTPSSLTDAPEVMSLWKCAMCENITLLQGEFAPRTLWQQRGVWYNGVLAAGVILALSALVISSLHYQRQISTIQQQTAAIRAQFFPGEKPSLALLPAIKQRIRTLQQRQNKAQFFAFGQQLRQVLGTSVPKNMRTLTFDADSAQMTLTFRSGAVQPFRRLNDQGNQISLQKAQEENMAILTVKGEQ